MPSVGVRLRHERESRGKTIDEMAVASGIGRDYLKALERDDHRALPGPAFGKLYIRAYAEILEFDPQPWIDDYDRERRLDPPVTDDLPPPVPRPLRRAEAALAEWRDAKLKERAKPEDVPEDEPESEVETEPELEPESEPAPVEAEPAIPDRRRLSGAVVTLIVVGVLFGGVAAYVTFVGRRAEPPPPVQSAPVPVPAQEPPAAPMPVPTNPSPKKVAPAPAPPIARQTPAGALTASEFGVGRRIVNLRLEGETDRFEEGARVCFATRIVGGRRGALIRHVWLYEGRVEQSIPLRLGGSDWRTHSNKTLGHAGAWAVEARDDRGRVLARAEFACGPPR